MTERNLKVTGKDNWSRVSFLDQLRDKRYKTIELYEHAEILRFYGHHQMADLYEAEAEAQEVVGRLRGESFKAWRKRRAA